jgi:hypothetical protein
MRRVHVRDPARRGHTGPGRNGTISKPARRITAHYEPYQPPNRGGADPTQTWKQPRPDIAPGRRRPDTPDPPSRLAAVALSIIVLGACSSMTAEPTSVQSRSVASQSKAIGVAAPTQTSPSSMTNAADGTATDPRVFVKGDSLTVASLRPCLACSRPPDG